MDTFPVVQGARGKQDIERTSGLGQGIRKEKLGDVGLGGKLLSGGNHRGQIDDGPAHLQALRKVRAIGVINIANVAAEIQHRERTRRGDFVEDFQDPWIAGSQGVHHFAMHIDGIGVVTGMAVAAGGAPGVGKIVEGHLRIVQAAQQRQRRRELFRASQQTHAGWGCEDTFHRSFEQ